MNESLSRITRYAQMLLYKPISQMGDVVHGIHTGTEWEAELRISDLREILSLIEGLRKELNEVRVIAACAKALDRTNGRRIAELEEQLSVWRSVFPALASRLFPENGDE